MHMVLVCWRAPDRVLIPKEELRHKRMDFRQIVIY